MGFKQRFSAKADMRKAAMFAIVVNSLELVFMVVVLLYILLEDDKTASPLVLRLIAGVATLAVGSGAVVDIREALSIHRVSTQVKDMLASIGDMEVLNNRLRAQRHDFLNHLQVVYSLMEMGEYGEATAYIEKVYGDIATLSRVLKTASPAVNALLQVKLAACEKAGIQVETHIQSAWQSLPIPAWEMCKVLSNLIDNAMDALQDTPYPVLTITLGEDLRSYRFSIRDNGPGIPGEAQTSIFEAGITSKGTGHGMGLYIVRQTLQAHGGDIRLTSQPGQTCFEGWVPKPPEDTAGEGKSAE